MRIGIINYGVGNTGSVYNAFWNIGHDPELVSRPEDIAKMDRLVLPGVGTPLPALNSLRSDGLLEAIEESVFKKGTPILGICLGMQLMADRLTEYGEHKGLGWIPGSVEPFETLYDGAPKAPVPHIGWAQIKPQEGRNSPLHDIGGRLYYYYAHTYVFIPKDEGDIVATSDHGVNFVCALMKGPIFATQFHPEKSQAKGEKLIERFIDWEPK